MKKVLVLSAPIGSGHKITAKALVQNLQKNKDIEIYEGDVFSFMPAWIGAAFMFVYLKVLAICPWLYAMAYSSGKSVKDKDMSQEQSFVWLRDLINRCLLSLGRAYIDSISPDIVLATHATPLGIMSLYKKEHPQLWLGAVVPDYNIHPWWLCRNVDAYFIADEALKVRFPKGEQVKAYGLPLRAGFAGASYAECRAEFGYTEAEKVVLLMGGGDGLLPMEEIAAAVLDAKLDKLRLVVVTGHNEALAKSLKARYDNLPESKLQVYGFRDDIPKLMTAADVLVSKGGAVTAAEALACGIDYIIYKPLPGQESGNASFLAKNNGVKVAGSIAEIVCSIKEASPGKDREKENLQLRKQAADLIYSYIFK